MLYLRQSTATTVQIGPVTGTDGTTASTGVTLSSNLLELYKAGATAAIDLSGRTWSHIARGFYRLDLLTTDLDTCGPLLIAQSMTSTRPRDLRAVVLAPTAYDALITGAALPADLTKIAGSSTPATNLGQSALGIIPVIVGSGSTLTAVATNLTSSTGQMYVGRTLVFVTGALAGQAASISGYNGATKVLTVSALTSAPVAADTAVIV